jgi:hypothetical protein
MSATYEGSTALTSNILSSVVQAGQAVALTTLAQQPSLTVSPAHAPAAAVTAKAGSSVVWIAVLVIALIFGLQYMKQ